MEINKILELASQEKFEDNVIKNNFLTSAVSCMIKEGSKITDQEIEGVFLYLIKANNFTQWAIGDVGLEMQWRGLNNVTLSICEYFNKSYPRISSNIRTCSFIPVSLRRERIPYTIYETICETRGISENEKIQIINEINNSEERIKTFQLRNKIQKIISEKSGACKYQERERIGLKSHPFAPSHEQGAVALFAIMSDALGFRILRMQADFPDCIAEKVVFRGRGGRRTEWKEMSIEIQLKASDFIRDKHDYTKCDALVCWINDVSDCPKGFEIIELKSELEKLRLRKPLLFDQ